MKIAGNAIIHAFSHLEGATVGKRRDGRTVRAAAAGCRSRREVEGRQFLRGQEGQDRGRRQGQPPHLYRRRQGRRQGAISAPAPSPAIMTATASSSPRSARAPSSAPIPRWSRRSGSATAPTSPRAASSPKSVPDDALAFGRARQKTLPERARQLRERRASAEEISPNCATALQ